MPCSYPDSCDRPFFFEGKITQDRFKITGDDHGAESFCIERYFFGLFSPDFQRDFSLLRCAVSNYSMIDERYSTCPGFLVYICKAVPRIEVGKGIPLYWRDSRTRNSLHGDRPKVRNDSYRERQVPHSEELPKGQSALRRADIYMYLDSL